MDRAGHWQDVYSHKRPDEVSWYQPSPAPSLAALDRLGLAPPSSLVDVGGGASTLVDALLERGWRDLTVVDIAEPALAASRERLGQQARLVDWVRADLTAWRSDRTFDVWHDRAVFHFLTAADDRARYVAQARRAVRPGGHVIVASFGPDGPTRCSGLDVVRYSPEAMHAEFGAGFELLDSVREVHQTPSGRAQEFTWCLCRARA